MRINANVASLNTQRVPGTHTVRVLGVALAESLGCDLFGSRTAALGMAGELRVGGTRIGIETTDSLDEIARRFNNVSSNTGITASVLTTGSGKFSLVLSTRNTGAVPGLAPRLGAPDPAITMAVVVSGDTETNVASVLAVVDAIENQSEAVARLFRMYGTADTQLELLAGDPLDQAAGSIGAVTGRIESSITLMRDRIESLEDRLDRRRAQLIRQFTRMEQAMSLAQSQSAWLTSQIHQLQANSAS